MAFSQFVFFVLTIKCGESVFNSTCNASLYNIIAYSERDRILLYKYYVIESRLLFYNLVTNQAAIPLKVVVDDKFRGSFEHNLRTRDIQYSYISHEIWKKYLQTHGKDYPLDPSRNFLTYNAILQWASHMKEAYPDNVQKRHLYQQTYEKRDILEVKITKDRIKRINIYIIGGENPRDWISIAVIMNYMNKMLKNFRTQGNSKKDDSRREKPKPVTPLLEYYNLHFIPVANPDGYVFNMESDADRFWSKNRKMFFKRMCIGGNDAVGVNIDRNWRFAETSVPEECNGVFQGSYGLSEAETYSLFKRINDHAKTVMAVINVKGFGRMITIPYAEPYMVTVNHGLMMQILPSVASRLRKQFNETFFYGTTSTFLFNYSGNMADYIKKKLNIPLVFTIHLQRGDNFLPNVDDIEILTSQLKIILEDILLLAKNIYGPLFNSQPSPHNNRMKYIVILMMNIKILKYYYSE